jgi:hypothetical protein
MLLSIYRLPIGNNIDIVVVQRYTTHNKILPWASHILRVPAFFILLDILFMLCLLYRTHFISWFKR